MKSCEYCGSELPVTHNFVVIAGTCLLTDYATVTDITSPLSTGITGPQTPPLFSNPLYPNIQSSGMEWQGPDSTLQTRWSVEDTERVNPQFTDRKTDENEAVLPDLLLPGMLAIQSQMPSPAQAPMVQGTPQLVEFHLFKEPQRFQEMFLNQYLALLMGLLPLHPPMPRRRPNSFPHIINQYNTQGINRPTFQYQPAPPPHELEHQHRHHTGPLHEHRPHSSKQHHHAAVTSKAGMGVVSKWLIVTIATLVIIGTSSIFLVHALMPTIPPPVLTINWHKRSSGWRHFARAWSRFSTW